MIVICFLGISACSDRNGSGSRGPGAFDLREMTQGAD